MVVSDVFHRSKHRYPTGDCAVGSAERALGDQWAENSETCNIVNHAVNSLHASCGLDFRRVDPWINLHRVESFYCTDSEANLAHGFQVGQAE